MNTTRRGSRYRKAVQDFLSAAEYTTRFRPWTVAGDDIAPEGDERELSVEAKDRKASTLSSFIDRAEGNAADHQIPVVVVKRRGPAVLWMTTTRDDRPGVPTTDREVVMNHEIVFRHLCPLPHRGHAPTIDPPHTMCHNPHPTAPRARR